MCGQVEYELGYGVSKRIGEILSKAKLIQVHTPSPRVTRILVPEKHSVMRKPC